MNAIVAGRFGIDTLGIREDSGQPVIYAYKVLFRCTGTINKVVVEIR